MLSLDKVNESILELKSGDTTFASCSRLADLIIVRDELTGQRTVKPDPLSVNGESDFLQAVNGRDSAAVWGIVDRHMQSIKILYPKEYEKVVREIMSV